MASTVGVTGVGLVKGSTVTQDQMGTSVGRVLAPGPAAEQQATPEESGTDTPTDGTDLAAEPATDPTVDPTPTEDTASTQDTATPDDIGTSELDPLSPAGGPPAPPRRPGGRRPR